VWKTKTDMRPTVRQVCKTNLAPQGGVHITILSSEIIIVSYIDLYIMHDNIPYVPTQSDTFQHML